MNMSHTGRISLLPFFGETKKGRRCRAPPAYNNQIVKTQLLLGVDMTFNFDQIIDRNHTSSVKFDGRKGYFGTEDVLPMWVADMDFAAPEAVTRALQARAGHPVYGYTLYPDELYDALTGWLQRRFGWQVKREWIMWSPGVVPSLFATVRAFTQPGEAVIVQPPVYFPFFSAVTQNERLLLQNPLELRQDRYHINFEELEQQAKTAKLMLLCTPHNPVGRVWSEQELQQVLEIARRNDVLVLADEIHADLVYPDSRHIPLAQLAENDPRVMTAVAPSKTFNIPGLGLSALIVPEAEQRAALAGVFNSLHVSASNPFSVAAFCAAYNEGEAWLDGLMQYLDETRSLVSAYLAEHLPQIRLIWPEGTYLLWLDCRGLGMDDAALKQFFVEQAKLGMNPGTVFGEGGSGFMRLNIGAPRTAVRQALEQIRTAWLRHS